MRVAVAGLTHLGVCIAVATHGWGVETLGFEAESGRAESVRRGDFDSAEPGVVEFLTSKPSNFDITTDAEDLSSAHLVLVAVDTVLRDDGSNDDSEVVALLKTVSGAVTASTPVVIVSQVRPGFTRAHSHLHPRLYYSMESLIFGRGIQRAAHPDRYVIGCADPHIPLPPVLEEYLALAGCPVHIMDYESAELTKLAANYVLAANITAANSLADLAARLGGDWTRIEMALRDDQRIGQNAYISAGLGIGGANLARDLHGIEEIADSLGADSSLARTMLRHSDYMRDWILRKVTQLRQGGFIDSLAILGIAYKPGTQSTRDGAGMNLVDTFSDVMNIRVHDPKVALPTHPPRKGVQQHTDIGACLAGADVIAVTTPYPEYRDAIKEHLALESASVILDPYRILDPLCFDETRAQLWQLGVGNG